jgi:hypothetical protein
VKYLVSVDTETLFRREARILQSIWREERGLDQATRIIDGKAVLLGSRISKPLQVDLKKKARRSEPCLAHPQGLEPRASDP